MNNKKKILIIGGYGFIGSNLYKALKKNNFVNRFGKKKIKSKKINFKNLKNNNIKFDYIIHCAGESTVKQSFKNNKNENDIFITNEILNYMNFYQRKANLIFLSSASVYGNSIKQGLLEPISPYGKNKLKCEKIIKKKSSKFNLNYKILRFFSIYGNGLKKQLIWDACMKIKHKDFTFFGNGNEVRSWMHINDVVNIFQKIIFNKTTNKKIFNFCGTQKMTNEKILKLIFRFNNSKFKPIFNHKYHKGNPFFMYLKKCDLKKIKYKQKIKFHSGIKNYIEWFKKQ